MGPLRDIPVQQFGAPGPKIKVHSSARSGDNAPHLIQIKWLRHSALFSTSPNAETVSLDRQWRVSAWFERGHRLQSTLHQLRFRGCDMRYAWYVTFEVHKRGTLQKRRSPRETKTFGTEKEAREFAREKFNEGLIVHAGTVIPHLPRRTVTSNDVPGWLDDQRDREPADAHGAERKAPG